MKLGEKLTEGPIFKKFVLFVIPVVITGFLQQLYNAADTVVVGQLAGDTALAAVGATSSLSALIITLFMGLSVGTNVVCAAFFGAENRDGLSKAIHASVLLGVVLGIPLTLVGWFGAEYFLTLTGTPKDVIGQAALYMKIYFLGVPFALVYNFGAAALRAMGDTKRPLCILTVAGVANVALNIVCVAAFRLGVVGVAIGTIVSQLVSAVWVILVFAGNKNGIRLQLSKLRLYKKELLRILAIGIPSGLNGIMFSLSGVIIQTAINSFGKVTIAAHSVAWNYMAFSSLLIAAGEQGVVSFVGQNMGAKRYDRVKRTVWVALITMTAASVLFSVFIVLFAKPLLGIFTDDAGVAERGIVQLNCAMGFYFLYVPDLILGGALRGMGRSMIPTIINLVFICLLRMVWIWFVWPLCPSLEMVYYSFPFTWIISGIVMAAAFLIEGKRMFFGGETDESRS